MPIVPLDPGDRMVGTNTGNRLILHDQGGGTFIGPDGRVYSPADRDRQWRLFQLEHRLEQQEYDRRNHCDPGGTGAMIAPTTLRQVDPFIAGRPEPTPPEQFYVEPLQAAAELLEVRRYDEAKESLTAYLAEHGEDVEVLRARALIDIFHDDLLAGIDGLAAAYALQPSIASAPVDARFLPRYAGDLRRAISSVVGRAHATKKPNAYFAAAVLMWLDDKPGPSRKMLDRSIELGLDDGIAREFRLVLDQQ